MGIHALGGRGQQSPRLGQGRAGQQAGPIIQVPDGVASGSPERPLRSQPVMHSSNKGWLSSTGRLAGPTPAMLTLAAAKARSGLS